MRQPRADQKACSRRIMSWKLSGGGRAASVWPGMLVSVSFGKLASLAAHNIGGEGPGARNAATVGVTATVS